MSTLLSQQLIVGSGHGEVDLRRRAALFPTAQAHRDAGTNRPLPHYIRHPETNDDGL
jgi:hypothetical protein